MPRYCDVNNDKKITLSEWLNCLNAHGAREATKTSTSEYNFQSKIKLFRIDLLRRQLQMR